MLPASTDHAVYDGNRRPAAVAAILLPFRSHIRQIGVVSWAGLRGAASIVFAIMAVLSKVPMHYNLYNLVFCVVLLSIAVQGTFLPLVSEKLRMIDRNMDVRRTFNDYEEESSIHFVKTHIQEGHLFCGKRVRDISLPPEMLIVMILRGEEKRIPNGDTLLLAGDLLILAAPEFTEGENLILRERTTVKGDKWTGKTLKEVPLSKGTLVVSVRRGEETLHPTENDQDSGRRYPDHSQILSLFIDGEVIASSALCLIQCLICIAVQVIKSGSLLWAEGDAHTEGDGLSVHFCMLYGADVLQHALDTGKGSIPGGNLLHEYHEFIAAHAPNNIIVPELVL